VRIRLIRISIAAVVAVGVGALASGPARAAGGPAYTEAPHSGNYYGATSTTSGGGGIFEDRALNTSAGQLICASAWLRTQFPALGASGEFVLWLTGETAHEAGVAHYSGLGNLGNWTEVHTCVEATSNHNNLRIQFYPTPGSPTVDMDDIDVHESLAANGGFEVGNGQPWVPYPNTHSNFSDYQGAALSGSRYGATNTGSGGGGIYQDVPLNTTAGQLICGSAWVRNEGDGTTASGQFVLWLTGDTTHESGAVDYGHLGQGSDWTEVQTCVEATGDHNNLRIQFYPRPGSNTVEIDDVDVHESLAANGGFEVGGGQPWHPYPNTHSNFSDYQGAALSGSHYGATNTASGGGGIYQDVSLNTTAGQLICGSAWLRNEGNGTTASGKFVLWLTGETTHESGSVGYGGLGNGSHWTEVQTCVEATRNHNNLRIQFYPTPGSNTVEIDDVDVHESLAANGGFEYGSAPWGTYPGTNSSYATYRTSLVYGPPPPVDPIPIPTPLPRPTARHALKVKLVLKWTWDYGLTWLDGVKIGRLPRDTRLTLRCLGRGCPHRKKASAVGRRRMRRLLRAWKGRRFRAGDHLIIELSAPGYLPQRAAAIIRFADLPRIRLL
jgi:hypothetical protein